MRLATKLMCAAALSLCTAAPAGAAEILDLIDQPTLDAFHTEMFGAITDQLGGFTHSFSFTTSALNTASSSVISIALTGGADIDFSSINLDGWAFEQHGSDPDAETWDLNVANLAVGAHSITVHGDVISGPATYSGTLNLGAVPEPATWAMMILGFGGVGGLVRSRRRGMAYSA